MGGARDWGTGLPLKADMLGKMSRLEVHHIFPKGQLYKHKYTRPEVNALANFCFLTKDTNLQIRDQLPEKYFTEIESKHPGALASQWIPMDRTLWKIENYRDFLQARRELLAQEANARLAELLHGDLRWLEGAPRKAEPTPPAAVLGGVTEEEEGILLQLNDWIEAQGLPRGQMSYDYSDLQTGEQRAIFDLAWPNGLQEGLTQPVAVLLNEEPAALALASQAGFRCFTDVEAMKRYVMDEVLGSATMIA